MQNRTLKIKDNSRIAFLIIAFGILPLVFIAVSLNVSDNYLIAFIITLIAYIIFFIWYFKDLKKREEDYTIIADVEGVTFRKLGSFKWNEISSIGTFTEIHWLRSSYKQKYLKISFANGKSRTINVSSYDLSLEELATEIRLLGKLN